MASIDFSEFGRGLRPVFFDDDLPGEARAPSPRLPEPVIDIKRPDLPVEDADRWRRLGRQLVDADEINGD